MEHQSNNVFGTEATTGRLPFLAISAATFAVLSSVLFSIDLVPELRVDAAVDPSTISAEMHSVGSVTHTSASTSPIVVSPVVRTTDQQVSVVPVFETGLPTRVVIDAIGVDVTVLAPASTDIDVLDRALLSGAVLYPNSSLPGERGNMLIFGHSSYLPVVRNKAFQAFNELGKLAGGEVVTVYTETSTYRYRVQRVELVDAEHAQVFFDADVPTLTLATCNTFGSKQERWIATATLINADA